MGPSWKERLLAVSQADRDAGLRAFLQSGLSRREKILVLLDAIPGNPEFMLDVLASLQPIEAADRLTAMLREARDPKLAVRLLQTLRAATLATSSENRVDLSDKELAEAFERVQSVFRQELARSDGEPGRFREAVAAIPDVFPADEATAIFKSLAATLAAGKPLPVSESEVFGRWLEFSVGAVEGRDFQQISAFVRNHPPALADERVKARVLDQLTITPTRPGDAPGVAELIDLLVPADAPDDSFVRWLDVKSSLTGARIDVPGLLRDSTPLRKAALIHFSGLDVRAILGSAAAGNLNAELTAAAGALPESEERDFLEAAAASISLGVRKSGP